MNSPLNTPKLSTNSLSLSDGLKSVVVTLRKISSPRAFWLALAGETLIEMMPKSSDRAGLYVAIGDWQREAFDFIGKNK